MSTPAFRRLVRKFVTIFPVLFLGIAATLTGFAAERAWITTDGVLSYDGDDWIAVGGVRLVQGETEIRAERLRYDVDAELVYFDGNVLMTQGDDQVRGSSLVYNVATNSGTISDAQVSYIVEGVRDPVYLLGPTIEFSPGQATVYDGRLTTCLPITAPGYYLQSRRIDIYPGDRIVVRNVRFVESGMTLFYWPYVTISLREGRPSRISFPEIGRNSEDGWYVRVSYAYDGPGDGYGEAIVDVTERRGIGTGVNHTYRDRPDSKGSFTAYRRANRATGHDDLLLGLKESFPLSDGLKVDLETAYFTEAGEDGEEERTAQLIAGIQHETTRSSTQAEWAGETTWNGGMEHASRGDFDHSGRAGSLSWRLNVDTFRHLTDQELLKEALAYHASATRRGSGYTLQLTMEKRMHSSLFSKDPVTPAWRSISRLPEANLTLDLERLVSPRLPVELGVGYGRLAEEQRVGSEYVEVAAGRTLAAFRLKPGSLSLGALGRWSYRAGAEMRQYSTGERRWILSADHQYRLPLGRAWSLLGVYAYREAFGDPSPFRYADTVSEYERVTGRLQYLSGPVSLSLSTGYDFRNARLLDLVGQASYRTSGGTALTLQGAYSLEQQRPTYAAGSVTVYPREGWMMTGSARYDFERQDFDRIQGTISYAFPGWRLDYTAIYNGVTDAFVAGEAALVRDLGCRQVGLRYDPVDEAVWLEYQITALPGPGVRIGASRERLLFDPEPLTDIFE